MNYRSYSFDLVPSDFHLLAPVKQHLCGRRFATEAEVTQALSYWLQKLGIDFFRAGTLALAPRKDKCSNVSGEYVNV
jgi:hypothetical protein